MNIQIKKYFFNMRNRYFLYIDLILFFIVPYFAYLVRFDGLSHIPPAHIIIPYIVSFTLIKIGILFLTGIYAIYWYHASIDDLLRILFAGLQILLVQFFLFEILKYFRFNGFASIPLSIPILDSLFTIFLLSLTRLTPRLMTRGVQRIAHNSHLKKQNALIIGAGSAGLMVLDEFLRNKNSDTKIIGFIDDDPKKLGLKVRGFKVLGNRNSIPAIVIKYDIKKIFIAIPSTSGANVRNILKICNNIPDVEILTLPPLYEIIDKKVEINKFRKIQLEDLLHREPIKTDLKSLTKMINGKGVLVTGAGGSIGSEICRQILQNNPETLYIIGHGENSIFELDLELREKFPEKKIVPIIADVKDIHRMRSIFDEYPINFVFHAAAHKHVPLMEQHPYEAISNNVMGTKNLIDLSIEFEIEKFIMISTDKAVNPTSIMGASKRVAEMVVIDAAKRYNKKFSVVRFGNVLGSRGSVIKVFQKQIASGGPITLTHPEIKRYFMTIPEAVQLVLQAFIIGNGGDVFVLDMGKPLKIIDLAKDLIRLSGLQEGEDIQIKITGLRPGEKLFEELFVPGENYRKTANEKIFIAENASNFIPEEFEIKLSQLFSVVNDNHTSRLRIKNIFKSLVPEYRPKEEKIKFHIPATQ
ncbi:polysaccharide biosynthesis protein [Calditrichota bacterium GD2]